MDKILKGYVLKCSSYKENDVIVTLLTKDGLETFKAVSGLKVTSKFFNALNPFTYGEYIVYYKNESSKYFLKECSKIDSIKDILSNIEKNIILSFLAESILKDEDFKNPYEYFETVFSDLKNEYNFYNIIAITLKYHLLYNGSFLESDKCVRCGSTKNIVSVSIKDGGFICSACNNALNLDIKSNDYLFAFRHITKATIKDENKFKVPDSVKNKLLFDLFERVEENCGLKFLSKSMIYNIL